MKKIFIRLVFLGLLLTIFSNSVNVKSSNSMQQELSQKIIRFHILANSDSAEDQALKLKVRDKVLQYLTPKLKDSKSIAESREILKANDENIKRIAEQVIKANGYNYQVSTTLSKENFPVKSYGSITLPQGEYEAYRILIGSGNGQNWWCVMFPPICFTDITKGEKAEKEMDKIMKNVLSEKEYEAINNVEPNKEKSNDNKIVVKFKVVELFNKIFKK